MNSISGEVTQALAQLPQSQQAALPGIRELLSQLQSRIAGNNTLPNETKVKAMEQLKVLAEAGKNPQAQEKRFPGTNSDF